MITIYKRLSTRLSWSQFNSCYLIYIIVLYIIYIVKLSLTISTIHISPNPPSNNLLFVLVEGEFYTDRYQFLIYVGICPLVFSVY